MKTNKLTKDQINQFAKKVVADKKLVRSYLKGQTPIENLNQRGIKFAKPL